MKILGIDMGTRHFAMCFMDEKEGIYHLEELNLSKIKSHKERRFKIWSILKALNMDEMIAKPDMVVLEKVILFHKAHINVDTIKRLGGLTYLIVDYYNCPTYEVAVQSWKSAILGNRSATKQDSIDYVKNRYNIDTKNDNLADAICIAEMGFKKPEKLKKVE